MFTPFRGQLLQSVLDRLQQVAQHHPIRLSTFGSRMLRVVDQSWLHPLTPDAHHEYKLVIFASSSIRRDCKSASQYYTEWPANFLCTLLFL